MTEQKTMQFANFNVTFGEKEEAMLTHFEDIIYPAFTAKLVRGSKNDKSRYSFTKLYITDELPRLHGKTATLKRSFNYSGMVTFSSFDDRNYRGE